ncbi:MAG: FAD-binding oxidoreductase [Chloroflexi bacterium]|nr:FAD-binding oxidoreductase [Chloroflexota bacterium]
MLNYDALVIGAGYIGCAVAHDLSEAGLRTALLDRGPVAAGASRANYGNVQVQDAELEHSLSMIMAGFERFANLEARLGRDVGLRKLGSLLLIENEAQWRRMEARLPALHAAGVEAELIPAKYLPEVEPLLDPASALGACYHPHEAQVNPFALIWAYVAAGQEKGLDVHHGVEVTGFEMRGGRVKGVRTHQGTFSCDMVALCTGAWTPQLARLLGREWAISHVRGQAIVTERSHLRLQNHVASAAFFEEAQPTLSSSGRIVETEAASEKAILAISQTAEGHFLLGEAALVTDRLDSTATIAGQSAIARLVERHFPAVRGLRVLRGWAAPVAYTDDELPFFGPVDGIERLFVAAAFKSTVIVTPLVGETVAQWALDGRTDLDLTPFSPDRSLRHVH